ncbi:MAG: Ldh family oxidoreductase [Pseudomonadota bacterium]|nr:Ldh family oxidoreductase [Pseudomonadota bacterium]
MSDGFHSPESLKRLSVDILTRNRTSTPNAESVAEALVAAQIDGHAGHGLSRLPSYAAQALSGKVKGFAEPVADRAGAAAVRIDAGYGFAFPALDLARRELRRIVPDTGIAAATIHRSHHFGAAGRHVELLAEDGLIGLVLGNSPKAIAPWGGTKGVFGTNPIAFAAPMGPMQPPLLIDLSLSKVARGKIMVAAKNDEPIPEGWALDADGEPTTDAEAALNGTMIPMGDAKGAALVLMVEILAAALTGANFGYEASSFFTADGDPPGVGQTLIALDPVALSGGAFRDRLSALVQTILDQEGTRLPGTRRLKNRAEAAREGIRVPDTLMAELNAL